MWTLYTACVLYHKESINRAGKGGGIPLRRVEGVRCVHDIEEKDCTARFAAMVYERFPRKNLITVGTVYSIYTGRTVQGWSPPVVLFPCTVLYRSRLLAKFYSS